MDDFSDAIERISDFAAVEGIDLIQLTFDAGIDGFETFIFSGDDAVSAAGLGLARAFNLAGGNGSGMDALNLGIGGGPAMITDDLSERFGEIEGAWAAEQQYMGEPLAGASNSANHAHFMFGDVDAGGATRTAANRNGYLEPIEGAESGGPSGVSAFVGAAQYDMVDMYELNIAYAPVDFSI